MRVDKGPCSLPPCSVWRPLGRSSSCTPSRHCRRLALLLFTSGFSATPNAYRQRSRTVLVSPADGKVIVAEGDRVSVFMNVFDVHVCRSPMAGAARVGRTQAGRFMAAYRDEASDHNERAALALLEGERSLTVTLVAGLVARRIVLRVQEGRGSGEQRESA